VSRARQVPPAFGFGDCPFRFVRLTVPRGGFKLALHGFQLGALARGCGVAVGDAAEDSIEQQLRSRERTRLH
jgi:hypothetical protein